MSTHITRAILPSAAFTCAVILSLTRALAINGTSPNQFNSLNGWSGFELVTQNNNISTLSDTGYGSTASRGTYDGLGVYRYDDTLSVFVNHETNTNAAISRVDLDLSALRQAVTSKIDSGATTFPSTIVTGMGYAYNTVYDGAYHALTNPNPVATGTTAVGIYGSSNFQRFCSGTSYIADSFGPGRGFADAVFLTGEEVFNSTGRFYALDPATRTLWEAPDLGGGSWENAALLDTGNTTHTALFLSEDRSGSTPQLYIGRKGIDANGDGQIDFLERNGLRGGTRYFFHPNTGASTTDLPDGTVSGTWDTSPFGSLTEDKLEDVHTNPFNGTQVVLADQTDGLYTIDFGMVFDGSTLDTANSTATITQIVRETGTGSLGNPDNVTWAKDNKVYVQQDGAGNGMWQMNPDGSGRTQIASAFSEPSGIMDLSEWIGYAPGSVLLSSIQGSVSSGAQLAALISPDAQALIEGDLDGDGFVGIGDLNVVLGNWNRNVTPGVRLFGDPSGDGFVGIEDLNVVLGNWNAGTPPTDSAAIPEPGAVGVIGVGLLVLIKRRG